MARKGGGASQRMAPPPISNGHTSFNHPPPSTLAAQIVHNAAHSNGRQDSASKVTFGELVKEFLQHPSTDEPDPQLIALVCVIVEAGLEGLLRDDPFAQDQQRQQGIDSIAVIELILRQKPRLLMSAKENEGEGILQPPLLLWLFPKLLGLLSHATLLPVHGQVQALLGLFLTLPSQQTQLWGQMRATLCLFKSCIQRK